MNGTNGVARYQTYNGQWRKEKRLRNGKVIGAYGWTDDRGILRLYDYLADEHGYRVVRERSMKVTDDGEQYGGVAENEIRRPASTINSIRRNNYEKVRKRSHESKIGSVQESSPKSRSLTKSNKFFPSLSHSATLRKAFSATKAPSPGNLGNVKQIDSESTKITSHINNINDLINHDTNKIDGNFGKSVVTNNDVNNVNVDNKKSNSKKTVNSDRFLMRGKKLSRFEGKNDDAPLTIEKMIDNAESKAIDESGHIDENTDLSQKKDLSHHSLKKINNLDVRMGSSRPKISMSRLLRAKQRQSSNKISTPTKSVIVKPYSKPIRPNQRRRNSNVFNKISPQLNADLIAEPTAASSSNLQSSSESISLVTDFLTSNDQSTNYIRKKRKPSFTDLPAQKFPHSPGSQTSIDFDTGNQFHYEVTKSDGSRVGRHGYVDPLGFLRVTNYVSNLSDGHSEQRTSEYVGTRNIGDGDYRCNPTCL